MCDLDQFPDSPQGDMCHSLLPIVNSSFMCDLDQFPDSPQGDVSFTTACVNSSFMCDLNQFSDSPQGGGCHSLLPMLTLYV